MKSEYVDSLEFIKSSQRDDYAHGVKRVYDVYLDGDNIWCKFRPNFTYKVRVSKNNFNRYVLDFDKSKVYLIPSKKNKKEIDEVVTYNNLYINNALGEVILDYNKTGEGKIDINDYLGVFIKCDSIIISNCDTTDNSNVFEGIVASNMKFNNCNIECNVKNNCIDDIDNLILDNSSIVCNISSFIRLRKLILNDSTFILKSIREVNLYSSEISIDNSMFGIDTDSTSRITYKYMSANDSKINSSNSGLVIHGIKKTNLVNSVIGNISYNNDINFKELERDNLSIIYNNVSERDSMSYVSFIEKYRGELRGLYLMGTISEFEYNSIINDLNDFLSNDN